MSFQEKSAAGRELIPMTHTPGGEQAPISASAALELLCKDREAFETDRWAIEGILAVELTTDAVIDPCSGTGLIGAVCRRAGLEVYEMDIEDWHAILPPAMLHGPRAVQQDFLAIKAGELDLSESTVLMNPPFSLACQFVDKARELGARKIICFQRQAWRESVEREEWWKKDRPARRWTCGGRASCFRFDLLLCTHGGPDACPNFKRKGKKVIAPPGCRICMGGAPTSHEWFVWERHHTGAEVSSAIYPVSGSRGGIAR